MMVKVFQSNANGKIEFTRAELEKLLNEVYKKGYNTGVSDTKQNYWTWTSPYVNTTATNNLRASEITYTTGTTGTTAIDNLRCDNATKVSTIGTIDTVDTAKCAIDALESKKSKGYATNVCADVGPNASIVSSAVAPSSITLQLSDVGELPTGINLAKSIDDIVNALFNGNPKAVKTGTIAAERSDAASPHDRLARELRNL